MQRWCWLICGGLVLGSGAAVIAAEPEEPPYPQACTTPPSASEQEAAKGAFRAGVGSYNEADYDRAILYWRDAYRRDCTAHELLRNLANAYERKGDRKEAIRALRLYLERVRAPQDKRQLLKRVENLESQLAAEAPSSTTRRPDAGAPVQGQDSPEGTSTQSAPPPPPPLNEPSSGGQSIAPWVVTGAGVALSAVGAYLYFKAHSDYTAAQDKCPNNQCSGSEASHWQSEGNDARDRMVTGQVVAIAGVPFIAGGLVWHFVFDKSKASPTQPSTALSPTMAPGYAGLSLGGRF